MTNPRDVRATGVGGGRQRIRDFSELNVVVLGGLVMDVFVRTSSLPTWGQAVQAESLNLQPGGKGLNQAIAASRLGANVSIIGAVGQDEFGRIIMDELEDYGVNDSAVDMVDKATSPVTIVFSKPGGETSFVGWKNADEVRVDAKVVKKHRAVLRNADILLSTLEVAPEAVALALEIASESDGYTVLNPAPPLQKPGYHAADLPLHLVDMLVPNEWEARELADKAGASEIKIREVAAFLGDPGLGGAKAVCITRAHLGCVLWRDHDYRQYPAYEIDAHDSTGASDAFCATLALHMCAGYETEEAIHQAQAAGAYSVGKMGTGKSMPNRRQLRDYRKRMDRARGI